MVSNTIIAIVVFSGIGVWALSTYNFIALIRQDKRRFEEQEETDNRWLDELYSEAKLFVEKHKVNWKRDGF